MAEVARIVRVKVVIVFTTTVEFDLDYIRLDIDAEQLVASLFGDDDSFVNFEQPPTDRRSSAPMLSKWFV